MKKSILLVGLSVALFAISSCDKNYDIETRKTISVVADATLSGQVKTSLSYDNVNGYSSDWDNEDVLGFYYLEEGSAGSAGADNRGTLNLGSVVDGVRGSFTGSITSPGESTEYVFNAYYPSNANNGLTQYLKLNQFRFTVPDVQNPLKDGFDPNADILVARPVKKTVSPTDESISLDFNFERVVSIVRISFPTIAYDGVSGDEKIMQVVLSKTTKEGNENSNLIAGRVGVNPNDNPMVLEGFSTAAYSKHSITANYTEETAPTLSDGSVYLTVVPRTFVEGDQLTVTVVTNKHTITKVSTIPSGQSLECPANAVKHLKVNITESAPNLTVNALAEEYYTKVTSASQITTTGQYILVYDNGSTGMVATSISDNKINAISVNYVSDKGYRVSDVETYDVRFEDAGAGYYFIKVAGNYVVYSGSSTDLINSVTESNGDNTYKWKVTVGDNGDLTILSAASERWIKYSTSGYFKAYGSGSSYKAPRLYVHP